MEEGLSVLEEQKFRVVVARNGNEARLKFANEPFNMVIVDIDLKAFKAKEYVEGIRRKENMKNVMEYIPILGV